MVRTVAVVAVGVAAVSVLAAGCTRTVEGSGSPTGVTVFDNAKMAQDIQSSEQGKSLGAVSCPPDELVLKGVTFDCHAGNNVTIHIKVTSPEGDYTWIPAQG